MHKKTKLFLFCILSSTYLFYCSELIKAMEARDVPVIEAVAAHQWRYGFYCRDVPNGKYLEYRIYNKSKHKWMTKSTIRSSAGCIEYATGRKLPSGVIYCQARYVDIQTGERGAWSAPMYQITQADLRMSYVQKHLTKSTIKLKWNKVPSARLYVVYVDTGSGLHPVKKTKSLSCTVNYKLDIYCPIKVAVIANSKNLKGSVEFVDSFYLD